MHKEAVNLIERFGMFKTEPVETLDSKNLFIKSGLNVIASLAGEGKTTLVLNKSEEWRRDGYEVYHFNFDFSPTYDKDMLHCPVTDEDFSDFFELIEKTCNEKSIIVIDSLKAMLSYMKLDVESNSDVYPVMQKLRTLIKKTKCTFILVHHVYKAKNVKTMPMSFYGARAIEEQCDSGFIYESTNHIAKVVKNRAGHFRDKEISMLDIL